VQLDDLALADLGFWANLESVDCQRDVLPPKLDVAVILHSDASLSGWGGVFAPNTPAAAVAGERWTDVECSVSSINILELRAARLTVAAFADKLRERTVVLYTDNSTVRFALTKGTSKVRHVMAEVRLFWQLLVDLDVQIVLRYVPTADNAADEPSRHRHFLPLEWSLDRECLLELERRWSCRHTLDVFASASAHLCDRWCSRLAQPGATAVDAFTVSWGGEVVIANPPFSLILRTLAHLCRTATPGTRCTLVAPVWKSAPWWPLLQALRPQSHPVPAAAVLPAPMVVHQRLSSATTARRAWYSTPEPLRLCARLRAFHLTF
jgi:hypothetical protein